MDFQDLRYSRAIAEQCCFSRAADVLQISQHDPSRAVQQPEIDLDAALFERHGHGARLTKTGRVLAKRTNTLLRQIEQTRAEIQGGIETPSGVLDFAIPPGAATYL
ncbi:MAG: LysR family transcriptional regulator, partial [Pseudomonadota bacterium]|nr:LysR family transcriptional regulator [Pseudomonadota bacterium]